MGFLQHKYWSGLPSPPPVHHVLSELSPITHPSWVALHGMAHSFIDYKSPFNTTRLLSMKGRYLLSSVQFSRSVVSDSLQPHESQHASPPCPLPNKIQDYQLIWEIWEQGKFTKFIWTLQGVRRAQEASVDPLAPVPHSFQAKKRSPLWAPLWSP